MQKYNKDKKQYAKDQETIKFFHELYRKSIQDNVFDKNEYESLCSTFNKYVNKTN